MPSTTATHAGTCRLWLVGVLLHALAGAAAAEPALTVATGGRTAIYTVAGLLGLPAATTVTIPADVAYKRSMTFRAIPFATLLDGVASDDNVRFVEDFVERLPAIGARRGLDPNVRSVDAPIKIQARGFSPGNATDKMIESQPASAGFCLGLSLVQCKPAEAGWRTILLGALPNPG